MIGVFDSGDGGILAVKQLKALAPSTDICFLADRENAPYGTKKRSDILRLAEENIRHLLSLGADRVLIACCTAGTVYSELPEELRAVSSSIIAPTAKAAVSKTKSGRIAVIATDATVASGAFGRAIGEISDAYVKEIPTQGLVTLVESGVRDSSITEEDKGYIRALLCPEELREFDTLILGCTHFPHLKRTVGELLPWMTPVSSVEAGVGDILAENAYKESGKITFTSKKKKGHIKWQNTDADA